MLIELDKSQRKLLQPFFDNMENTLVRTCLQGHMGRAWTDSMIRPSFGLLQVGDFCLINGAANRKMMQMLTNILHITGRESILLVPCNDNIRLKIHRNFPGWNQVLRYAFQHKTIEFDLYYLKQIISALPEEYELVLIDEYWYHKAISENWSRDLVSNFESSSDFINRGIGVIITYNGEILSGASSYSVYDGGIEIQVDTEPTKRMKGLGRIASAALIIACRQRNIYPNWDAANEISVQLALKLGYNYSHSYYIYMID